MKSLYTLVAFALLACGTAQVASDPGTGSNTLLVVGAFDLDPDAGTTDVTFRITHDGADVNEAILVVASDVGAKKAERSLTIARSGRGAYNTVLADTDEVHWARGSWYHVSISADAGNVDATVLVPDPPNILEPNPKGFDPHNGSNGTVTLRWSGAAADLLACRTTGYVFPRQADPLQLLVQATVFTEATQQIDLERLNTLDLAGGAAGSTLSTRVSTKTDMTVTNPYVK